MVKENESETGKKGIFGGLIGRKKAGKSACCAIELEEIPEEMPAQQEVVLEQKTKAETD